MRATIPQEEWDIITEKRLQLKESIPFSGNTPNTYGFGSGSLKGAAVGIVISYFMGFPVNLETTISGYGIGSIAGISFARYLEQQKQQEHAKNR